MDESGYAKYVRFMQRDGEGHRVIEWSDAPYSSARGWLVMNSLTGGAAGGGTRMTYRQGAKPEDYLNLATFLAKTMEIKFRVAGPVIGGAKSVICFNGGDDSERKAVLARWFEHIAGEIRSRYGTGGDLGVDERVVLELTQRLGIAHPQLGIVVGHFGAVGADLEHIVHNLERGVALPVALGDVPGRRLAIADLATGLGVATAVACYYQRNGDGLRGKRVVVEGFGNVGAASAYYLAQAGARVVGIVCKLDGKYRWHRDDGGLDVAQLLGSAAAADKVLPLAGAVEGYDATEVWSTPAEVFVPAAASFTVDAERLAQLRRSGVEVIACGANNPFQDEAPGAVDVQRQADQEFAVIPDFVANCGMARVFSYLMDAEARVDVEAIQAAVVATVRSAMTRLLDGGRRRGLVERAFALYVPD